VPAGGRTQSRGNEPLESPAHTWSASQYGDLHPNDVSQTFVCGTTRRFSAVA
jgi:hypothetical protein